MWTKDPQDLKWEIFASTADTDEYGAKAAVELAACNDGNQGQTPRESSEVTTN